MLASLGGKICTFMAVTWHATVGYRLATIVRISCLLLEPYVI